jgi:hypothetical protein
MTVSYVDSNRREDLRSAALFVIDDERQATGYDKRVRGSAGVPDVIRIFDEMLTVFPLESEVGEAISAADEIPCWRAVLEKMEPIWKLWPSYSSQPEALLRTDEWSAVQEAVQECVDKHGLWHEEIEYPATVLAGDTSLRIAASDGFQRLDPTLASTATVVDTRGRPIELNFGPTVGVRRVGLPPPAPT